jgi:hypothetical protein
MSALQLHNATYPACGCSSPGGVRRIVGGLSVLVCAVCGKLTTREKGQ